MSHSTKNLLGLFAGAAAGYGYYATIGCSTGSCWISGDPLTSSAYFGLLGWVLAGGGQDIEKAFGWMRGLLGR